MAERDHAVLDTEATSENAEVSAEWQMFTLGELTDNFDSLRVPVKQSERRPGPYLYYGASGVVDHVNGFLFDGQYLLIAEDGENLKTRTTPIALLANGKFWVNNHAHIVRGNSNADTRFLMYALAGLDISGYLTGSTRPKLTQGNMNRIELLTPPLPEQRAIAHVLGTLDDKIELNRRMNETLEEMARALFKSWFVDFDPVRAKMEGRWRRGQSLPGLPTEHYDRFPNRLVNSEFGEIPEGLKVRSLGDLLSAKNVKSGDHNVPEYSCTNYGLVPRSERFKKKLSMSNSKNKLVCKGDCVFGLSRRVLNFGLMRDDIGCVSPAYRTYSTDEDLVIPDLLERIMRLQSEYFYLAVSASSREGQSISQDALYELKTSLPNIAIQQHIYDIVHRFSLLSNHISLETCTLSTLRDALLPRLVSGDVSVKDVLR